MTDSSEKKGAADNDTEGLSVDPNDDQAEFDQLGIESGANLAEYSILLGLLLVIALIAIQNVGKEVSALHSGNARAISEALN